MGGWTATHDCGESTRGGADRDSTAGGRGSDGANCRAELGGWTAGGGAPREADDADGGEGWGDPNALVLRMWSGAVGGSVKGAGEVDRSIRLRGPSGLGCVVCISSSRTIVCKIRRVG